MATHSVIKIVNEIAITAKKRGITHLYADDNFLNGREVTIGGRRLINFGSCSYLGLETDQRLKDGAIDAVQRYGTQFSSSRTYMSCGNYAEFESLAAQVFGAPLLLSPSSTMGHLAVMPIIIESGDAVIYDQQAHYSMQEVGANLKHNETYITMVRHNRMEDLEAKIIELREKHQKIWYVVDGVYSMYGDYAPLSDIIALMKKYKQLHLYADDAHGMSWTGKNGSGYLLSQTSISDRMVVATSLAKGFGSCGGVFMFPNEEMRDKVRNFGGCLTHSGPQQPATIGASIASAKIHLSPEIYTLHASLNEKITYCNMLLREYNIPLVSNSEGPIFFVGVGITKMGYNMVHRLMGDGYYTNLGIFPAVPEGCTGVRFTINNHLRFEDIEGLVKSIAHHLPLALKEENRTMTDVVRAFKKVVNLEEIINNSKENLLIDPVVSEELVVEKYDSITKVDKTEWNNLLEKNGSFDYDNLKIFESVFQNNEKQEDNWGFTYCIIRDRMKKPILATFFSSCLVKDDMTSSDKISQFVEKERLKNPYFLVSKCVMMGCLLSNGDHLYIDKTSGLWRKALSRMLDLAWELQEKNDANMLFLRDFKDSDKELNEFFTDHGFIKMDIENDASISNPDLMTETDFIEKRLNSKKRYYLKSDVEDYKDMYSLKIGGCSQEDVPGLYELYKNVKNRSLGLNTFDLPISFFEKVVKSDNWEIMRIYNNNTGKMASMFLCAKNNYTYYPMIIGMDYSEDNVNVYKQSLYLSIKRGLELQAKEIRLGLTTSDVKRKLGAEIINQIGFVQMKDNYSMSYLSNLELSI